jgi:hypothetical protein
MNAQRLKRALSALVCGVIFLVILAQTVPVRAAISKVQSTTGVTDGGTSVSATFAAGATANNLLIAICGARASVTFTGPSGFSSAINEAGSPSQGIFYLVAAGGETTLSCSSGGTSSRLGIHIYEYGGTATSSPFDVANSAASRSTTPATGSINTNNADSLLIAGITVDGTTSLSSWTNSFVEQHDFANGGNPGSANTYGGADLIVSSTGTYSTGATSANGNWRGQIAAFMAAAAGGTLTVDIVDGSGNPVANPSVAMSSFGFKFDCNTSTGTFGTSSEKIRAQNTTAGPAWTLTIAATSGATANWSAGTPKYDFNDGGGSPAGCGDGGDSDSFGGQLTVDSSGGTLTQQSGCNTTGLSLGSSAAFLEGTTDSITLLTASASAGTNCYWDLTGLSLSQKVPPEQTNGSYTINFTLTITAS